MELAPEKPARLQENDQVDILFQDDVLQDHLAQLRTTELIEDPQLHVIGEETDQLQDHVDDLRELCNYGVRVSADVRSETGIQVETQTGNEAVSDHSGCDSSPDYLMRHESFLFLIDVWKRVDEQFNP